MRGQKNGAYSTLLEDFWKVDLYLGKMFATKQNKNARSAIFTWLNVVSQKIFEKKIRNPFSINIQRITIIYGA